VTAPVWSARTARMGRNDLPHALASAVLEENGDPLPRSEIAYAIAHSWPLAEWPQQALGIDAWLAIWDAALPDAGGHYLAEAVVTPIDSLPDSLHLYRGCSAGMEAGMSWTADRDQAVWFATRFGSRWGEPMLLETDVPSALVLGHFREARREDEWVIDVTCLEPADLEGRPVSR